MRDAALRSHFDRIYSELGRPSIPPEYLLLQVFYSIRSELQLMEKLNYNLLYRWFAGLDMDVAVWVRTVFSKNQDWLFDHGTIHQFLRSVIVQSRAGDLLSEDHFPWMGRFWKLGPCRNPFSLENLGIGRELVLTYQDSSVAMTPTIRLPIPMHSYIRRAKKRNAPGLSGACVDGYRHGELNVSPWARTRAMTATTLFSIRATGVSFRMGSEKK